MMFERKSMEELLQRMIDWTRGSTTKVTDFRVGSRIRTLYESVALITEELYDKVFRSTRILIEENIYTVLGFPKRPATYATGTVTFGRETPADSNYLITLGTVVRTMATQNSAPIEFRTTADVLLPLGQLTIDAPVICQVAGLAGNVEANSIVEFVTKPSGIETVTNVGTVSNGVGEETRDEQKLRFQLFMKSLSRGTLPAIEYGAVTSELRDSEGLLLERVTTARAFEYLPARKGEVDVYIWNGAGAASVPLKDQVKKVIEGYYDAVTGEPIYGYKAAGIIVTVYSATAVTIWLKVAITPEVGIDPETLKPSIEREIDEYFGALILGQALIQTALETRLKLISGMYDVKLSLSTNSGSSYNENNVTPSGGTEILVARKPIIYV